MSKIFKLEGQKAFIAFLITILVKFLKMGGWAITPTFLPMARPRCWQQLSIICGCNVDVSNNKNHKCLKYIHLYQDLSFSLHTTEKCFVLKFNCLVRLPNHHCNQCQRISINKFLECLQGLNVYKRHVIVTLK